MTTRRRVLSLLTNLGICLGLAPAARPAGQAASPAPPPQPPGLTFRSTANCVEVDAIVTNADGTPARNLTATDFEVSEDGRPQPLSVCAFVDIPVVRPDPPLFKERIVEPDVVTNARLGGNTVVKEVEFTIRQLGD